MPTAATSEHARTSMSPGLANLPDVLTRRFQEQCREFAELQLKVVSASAYDLQFVYLVMLHDKLLRTV